MQEQRLEKEIGPNVKELNCRCRLSPVNRNFKFFKPLEFDQYI